MQKREQQDRATGEQLEVKVRPESKDEILKMNGKRTPYKRDTSVK